MIKEINMLERNDILQKIMAKKYGYLGICDFKLYIGKHMKNVDLYWEKYHDEFVGPRIELHLDGNTYLSHYGIYWHRMSIRNNISTVSIDRIKEAKSLAYKPQYEQAILYFSEIENIKNCIEYVFRIYDLVYKTTYIHSLLLGYAFLLSNQKNKIFPKEIAKLITQKILFFKN